MKKKHIKQILCFSSHFEGVYKEEILLL